MKGTIAKYCSYLLYRKAVYLAAIVPVLLILHMLFLLSSYSMNLEYHKKAKQLFGASCELLKENVGKLDKTSGTLFLSKNYLYLLNSLEYSSFDYEAAQLSERLKSVSILDGDIWMTALYSGRDGYFFHNYGAEKDESFLTRTFSGSLGSLPELLSRCQRIGEDTYLGERQTVTIKNKRYETVVLIKLERGPLGELQKCAVFFLKPNYFLGGISSESESLHCSLQTERFSVDLGAAYTDRVFWEFRESPTKYELELVMKLPPSFTPGVEQNLIVFLGILAVLIFLSSLCLVFLSINDFSHINRIVSIIQKTIPREELPPYPVYSYRFLKQSNDIITDMAFKVREKYEQRSAELLQQIYNQAILEEKRLGDILAAYPRGVQLPFEGGVRLCAACITYSAPLPEDRLMELLSATAERLVENLPRINLSVRIIPTQPQGHLAVIFSSRRADSQEKVLEEVREYLNHCADMLGQREDLCIGISQVKTDWDLMRTAYKESREALCYASRRPETKLLLFEELKDAREKSFYFPVVEQMELTIGIVFSDHARYLRAAERIIGTNCYVKRCSPHVAGLLLFLLRGVFDKTLGLQQDGSVAAGLSHICNIPSLLRHGLALLSAERQEQPLYRAIQGIDQRFREHDFSIKQIAELFRTTPRTLAKDFAATLGFDIQDYVRHRRMAYAQQLIAGGSIKLSEISILCGYSSENVFIRVFKSTFGVTPQKYRQLQKTVRGECPVETA